MTTKVPYDTTKGSTEFDVNMLREYHHFKTLEHNSILGWIFGLKIIFKHILLI